MAKQECYCENCGKITIWKLMKKSDYKPRLIFNYYKCNECKKGIDKKTFKKQVKKFKKSRMCPYCNCDHQILEPDYENWLCEKCGHLYSQLKNGEMKFEGYTF